MTKKKAKDDAKKERRIRACSESPVQSEQADGLASDKNRIRCISQVKSNRPFQSNPEFRICSCPCAHIHNNKHIHTVIHTVLARLFISSIKGRLDPSFFSFFFLFFPFNSQQLYPHSPNKQPTKQPTHEPQQLHTPTRHPQHQPQPRRTYRQRWLHRSAQFQCPSLVFQWLASPLWHSQTPTLPRH